MVRNAIFDFGAVLVEWNPDRIVSTFWSDRELRSAASSGILRHSDWQALDRGTIDEDEAIERFATRLGRPREELQAFLAHVRRSLVPIEGTVALLRELVARGVPVYGLSNMASATFEHLRARDDFWALFHGIVVSAEVKLLKPEPAIYEALLERFGLVANECVFADDHAPNVEAARALGFHAFRFETPAQCRAEMNALLRSA